MVETNNWYKILRVALYAVLLTPLWISAAFLFPFITTKILYFRFLIELALLLYLPLAWRYPEIRPSRSPILLAVWAYIGLVFLTSLVGLNFARSFWGTIERGEGVVTLLHFAAYLTMLSGVWRDRRQWYWYLFGAVSVSAVTGLYAFLQILGAPVVAHAGEARISGTIGNPAFFAAYLMFGLFLSLHLIRQSGHLWQRRCLWTVFWGELLLLFLTQTRGAVLATAAAFGAYFLLMLIRDQSKKKKMLATAGLCLLLLVGGFLVFARGTDAVQWNGTLKRLATISPQDTTTQSRLDAWRASWHGWRDQLWIGYGYENYNIAFNKYFPPRIFKDHGSQLWFDRAHNVVFDVGTTSGIVGLVAYLGIFAAALGACVRRRELWLGLLLAAYFLQNLFVFDTQATYLMFYLVLGFLAFRDSDLKQSASSGSPVGVFKKLGISLVILLALPVAYFVNIKPAFANRAAVTAIKAGQRGEFLYARERFAHALSYDTYMDDEIRLRLADHALAAAQSGQLSKEEMIDLYQFTIAELRTSVRNSPHDARLHAYLVTVMNRAYPVLPDLAEETVQLARNALSLSPDRQQILFEVGQALMNTKDEEGTIRALVKAVELSPQVKESRFNLLIAAIMLGREEVEREQKEWLLQGGRLAAADYLTMGSAYHLIGEKQKVVESYRAAVDLEPENPELRSKLAAAYGLLCDTAKAQAEVAAVVRLMPEYRKSASQFLQELAKNCGK